MYSLLAVKKIASQNDSTVILSKFPGCKCSKYLSLVAGSTTHNNEREIWRHHAGTALLNRNIQFYVFFFLLQGDLVWFDPGVGHVLPGEVLEFHRAAQVLTVQAVIGGKVSPHLN